jgi:hypothetical protein
MAMMTTVKRARDVFARKEGITVNQVTSSALKEFMTSTAGGGDVPGLSGGNLNRNYSFVNSMFDDAWNALVALEGLTLKDMQAKFKELTGQEMDDEEGNCV